jgi:voltage-gated potassium channel
MIIGVLKNFYSVFKNKEFLFGLLLVFIMLGIGTIVYNFIEGFSLFDSLYLSVITLTTIGYGDIYPVTQLGKLFTIIYIFIGIGLIFSFIRLVSTIQMKEYSKFNHYYKIYEKPDITKNNKKKFEKI